MRIPESGVSTWYRLVLYSQPSIVILIHHVYLKHLRFAGCWFVRMECWNRYRDLRNRHKKLPHFQDLRARMPTFSLQKRDGLAYAVP